MSGNILTLLVAVPAVAALLLAFVPRENTALFRVGAAVGTVVTFLVSLVAMADFAVGTAEVQMIESKAWIPEWGITYVLGLDGISVLLVLLTTFIFPLVVLASWEHTDRT